MVDKLGSSTLRGAPNFEMQQSPVRNSREIDYQQNSSPKKMTAQILARQAEQKLKSKEMLLSLKHTPRLMNPEIKTSTRTSPQKQDGPKISNFEFEADSFDPEQSFGFGRNIAHIKNRFLYPRTFKTDLDSVITLAPVNSTEGYMGCLDGDARLSRYKIMPNGELNLSTVSREGVWHDMVYIK